MTLFWKTPYLSNYSLLFDVTSSRHLLMVNMTKPFINCPLLFFLCSVFLGEPTYLDFTVSILMSSFPNQYHHPNFILIDNCNHLYDISPSEDPQVYLISPGTDFLVFPLSKIFPSFSNSVTGNIRLQAPNMESYNGL